MAIRVLLADDHALLRQGLRRLSETESEISIVGEAGNGVEAEELAASLRPDVILMDLQMPERDGAEATENIAGKYPEIGVVLLTWFVFQIGFTLAGPSPFVPAMVRHTRPNARAEWHGVIGFVFALALLPLSAIAWSSKALPAVRIMASPAAMSWALSTCDW